MSRVKGGVSAHKRRTNILKRSKGYRHGRSTKIKQAHEGLMRAGRNAFAHRRAKKNDFRRLWIMRLNAAVRENGHKSYSTFIAALKKNGITLDRKVLAEFAAEKPEVFTRIVTKVK
jgi:large subunit ribosomal protein L20